MLVSKPTTVAEICASQFVIHGSDLSLANATPPGLGNVVAWSIVQVFAWNKQGSTRGTKR